LLAGDLGELTDEMGTVVTYSRSKRLFDRTLAKMAPLLRANGYCGYINLNTIVNDEGIWPLEFTCRFGYPGYAILDPLQKTPWADLFRSMLTRSTLNFEVEPGFVVGIVITTPPFPLLPRHGSRGGRSADPVRGRPLAQRVATHALRRGRLAERCAGHNGTSNYTLVVTGTGKTIEAARNAANVLADKVVGANARYRRDIGTRLIEGEFAKIEALELLDP
jgi:phosphoribosylamine---glycine ligase